MCVSIYTEFKSNFGVYPITMKQTLEIDEIHLAISLRTQFDMFSVGFFLRSNSISISTEKRRLVRLSLPHIYARRLFCIAYRPIQMKKKASHVNEWYFVDCLYARFEAERSHIMKRLS